MPICETERENRFIDGLGAWNDDHPRDRLELLKKYLEAAALRKDWAGIERDKIIKRVRSEIGG